MNSAGKNCHTSLLVQNGFAILRAFGICRKPCYRRLPIELLGSPRSVNLCIDVLRKDFVDYANLAGLECIGNTEVPAVQQINVFVSSFVCSGYNSPPNLDIPVGILRVWNADGYPGARL
jgi:hypothetical protein